MLPKQPSSILGLQEGISWPMWFRSVQRQAWEEFLSTPPPSAFQQEAWRFSSVQTLELPELHCGVDVNPRKEIFPSLLERSIGLAPETPRLIFANHTPVIQKTQSLLPLGLVMSPLQSAIHTHGSLIRRYFMKQPAELGSHKYAMWHKARLRNGVFIYVPPDTAVEVPVEIFSWLDGRGVALSPHTLIVCGENSCITVLEHFRSVSQQDGGFVCGVSDIHLAAGARVTYAAMQEWSALTRAWHLNSTLVSQNARATVFQANFGAGFLRSESLSRLTGCKASSLMLSLTSASDTQEVDQRTLQDHIAPNTSSDLLYHNTLDDSARTIFSGLIRVEPHAQRTDAYQKVRNLLLSDAAEANSMPGLEILADDVRCTHGATSGQINEEELFYMKTRGIPARLGRQLIANGFLSSVLERLEDKTLRAFFMNRLHGKE
ncbi:FeS cluster assembly protein SufD [Candidatus Xiphinematobacter sp. Idaho Grape]|nr:FeS cluster assembly protein SufD [Candidatus Xiphinematobacter sp. Idaho Grape]